MVEGLVPSWESLWWRCCLGRSRRSALGLCARRFIVCLPLPPPALRDETASPKVYFFSGKSGNDVTRLRVNPDSIVSLKLVFKHCLSFFFLGVADAVEGLPTLVYSNICVYLNVANERDLLFQVDTLRCNFDVTFHWMKVVTWSGHGTRWCQLPWTNVSWSPQDIKICWTGHCIHQREHRTQTFSQLNTSEKTLNTISTTL